MGNADFIILIFFKSNCHLTRILLQTE